MISQGLGSSIVSNKKFAYAVLTLSSGTAKSQPGFLVSSFVSICPTEVGDRSYKGMRLPASSAYTCGSQINFMLYMLKRKQCGQTG
jgi:hypothetical protein